MEVQRRGERTSRKLRSRSPQFFVEMSRTRSIYSVCDTLFMRSLVLIYDFPFIRETRDNLCDSILPDNVTNSDAKTTISTMPCINVRNKSQSKCPKHRPVRQPGYSRLFTSRTSSSSKTHFPLAAPDLALGPAPAASSPSLLPLHHSAVR
jgi:hypothetical protein